MQNLRKAETVKKKKWIIILIISAVIIAVLIGCHYVLGPRFCSDGVSDEKCLYYKSDIYYSMQFIDKPGSLESYGIVLNKKISSRLTEQYYLATDKYADEVIVVEYDDYYTVFKT